MTAGEKWYEATRDIENETGNIENTDRITVLNDELRTVATSLNHLFGGFYEKTIIFHRRKTAKYLNVSTGNYVAATKTLNGTMNIPFTAFDRECLVGFRVGSGGAGANNFLAYVDDVLSGTSIVVRGDELPSLNTGVNAIELYSTVINVDGVSLESLDIMRANATFLFKIESSLTDYIIPLSHDELIRWDPTDRKNQGKIVWTISGPMVLMKKATDIGASYGTIQGRYPGMPRVISGDGDDIHLPDGGPQSIYLLRLKKRLRERFAAKPMPEYKDEMRSLVELAHTSYGLSAQSQEAKRTIEALN